MMRSITNGRLKKGDVGLVQGASSGVGLMALKIAKLMGAGFVIGTSTNEAPGARGSRSSAPISRSIAFEATGSEAARKATGGKGVDLIIDQISGQRRGREHAGG